MLIMIVHKVMDESQLVKKENMNETRQFVLRNIDVQMSKVGAENLVDSQYANGIKIEPSAYLPSELEKQ